MVNKRLGLIDVVSYLAYLVLAASAAVYGERDTLWYVGLSCSAVCAVAWFVARWQLGRSFSVGPEARGLVTHGLYSRFRHPIYVFGTLAFLFSLLALQGWQALIVWVVVIAVQLRRARREERVLEKAFGAEYAAYRARTWF
jgi:protein-S-isoprenylcysteine O-methyltransferase Ste14